MEIYKRIPEEQLANKGKEIYKKYFDASSNYELNVEGKLRKELDENIKAPSRGTFDGCQASIWKMLELDCYPKFIQSVKYKEYMGKRLLLISFRICLNQQRIIILLTILECLASGTDTPRTRDSRSATVWMVEDWYARK